MQNKIITRDQVVASAKTYLGIPWRHQGRTRASVDCVGLVLAVGYDLGVLPPKLVVPPYKRIPDASLLGYFQKHMTAVQSDKVQNGTAVVYSYGGSPFHVGIIVDVHSSAIIHAYAVDKKVVIGYLDSNVKGRRYVQAFDYKGI